MVAEKEADKAESVNAGFRAIDADVAGVAAAVAVADAKAQEALDNGGSGTGVPQGAVTVINVSANRGTWTDTLVDFDGEDGLWLEASGLMSHQAAPAPLYGPYHSGGAYLVWTLITDGSVPNSDVAGQRDFRAVSTAYRKVGRLWVWIKDFGHSDNQGGLEVKVHRFTDLGEALAPLADMATVRSDVVALTIRVAALEAASA